MIDARIHIEIDMKVHLLDRLGGGKPLELSICSCNTYKRSVFINKLFYSKKYIAWPYRIIRNHDWCERY